MRRAIIVCLVLSTILFAACAPVATKTPQSAGSVQLKPVALGAGQRLKVMATTNIIEDLARNVGGDFIGLTVLLPVGTDPHSFEPTPQDAKRLADAQVILANGLGLEEYLAPLLKNAGANTPVVDLAPGVTVRTAPGNTGGAVADPHIWTSPANAIIMAGNIAKALSAIDPANAPTYSANTAAYVAKLQQLDDWVRSQIATIPAENRKMVVSHDSLGYYADRYGLTLVGTVIPGFSSIAEPSAQQITGLEDAIRRNHVSTIFVENTVNPALADSVAKDVGVKVVKLYSDSLGVPGSGAETYIDYIHYNTNAITGALR